MTLVTSGLWERCTVAVAAEYDLRGSSSAPQDSNRRTYNYLDDVVCELVFLCQGCCIQHFARFPKLLLFPIPHIGSTVSKYLNLAEENVENSATGALKDSWQSELLLTF